MFLTRLNKVGCMTEVIENSKLGPGSDVNQPMKVSCAGRPFFYFNSQNKILDCNDAFVSLIKTSKNKLIGSDLNPTGQNPNFIIAIQKATAGGISTFRGNLVLGNGLLKVNLETVLIKIESANHHDQGIICYVLECYVPDIETDKEAADAENVISGENRERADFLDLVINTIKLPFFVKDEDHKWVMLNDAAVEMMGSSREGLLGKSDYDLYPGDQADIFWKYDEKVFAEGSSINEEQITWSDGTLHDIVTHKQLYIEKTSGRKFIVGTIHDISNYKKIEQDLRASEMKYRELFDNANDFIITTDLEGNITNANRTLLNYLKTDIDTITKFNVYDYVSEDNKEFVFGLKDKILSGMLESSFEVNALDLDRKPVTYEIKASLINEDDNLVGIQCVFSDVTESKEARLKLEKYNKNLLELNKTKDKFFSIIAHDLRNPYSSMIGFSELLLEDLEKLSMDEIRDSLKIIRNSAKNSLNLLENLLAWSRLETGRMHFDPSKVVLTDLVDEVVNVLFSLAYRKKIEINNMVESDVLLHSDKNMLNTILNNLVMNAIKFTPIGGEINIYATRMATDAETGRDFYKISVADTGIGMDAEFCKQLFTQNKPVSNPGTEKEQGTGLGLLLSREMVERHGGKISAESIPGKGSVFSFLIPAFIQE